MIGTCITRTATCSCSFFWQASLSYSYVGHSNLLIILILLWILCNQPTYAYETAYSIMLHLVCSAASKSSATWRTCYLCGYRIDILLQEECYRHLSISLTILHLTDCWLWLSLVLILGNVIGFYSMANDNVKCVSTTITWFYSIISFNGISLTF